MPESKFFQKLSPRGKKTVKILQIVGLVLLFALLGAALINSLLCVFVPHYYPTWGNVRYFAIVSDSMEPTIMTGDMITSYKPSSQEDISVGDVITYEYTQRDGSVTLITHRVLEIGYAASGEAYYVTRGDNADGADGVRPTYSQVVGVYTGSKTGALGYIVGFLQSTEGAIALILTVMIAIIAYVVVRFVNLVNTWRNVAVLALKKSGALLKTTENEDLVTISDVIGIITKDPTDRKDARRKDKKLKWFVETGMLPQRPYSDDLDEAMMSGMGQKDKIDLSNGKDGDSGEVVTERTEKMRYKFSFTAKVIQLKSQVKEWYSKIKNEILSYNGVKCRSGNKYETFFAGRKAVARFNVRGKTLCLLLSADPQKYASGKFAVETANSSTPCLYRIKSERRAKYACQLVADVMDELSLTKDADYQPKDYFMPYEGVVGLMQRDLVKRNVKSFTKKYRIQEIDVEDKKDD